MKKKKRNQHTIDARIKAVAKVEVPKPSTIPTPTASAVTVAE
jgi:hypothetical protein